MFRYGLLFNGYSKRAFFWEATMATRKASIVALGVFGSLTGVESQTHVGLALLVAFLVIHLVATPYDKDIDPGGILHTLDTTSLVIVWGTLWSGVLFLRGNLPGRVSKELLTVVIVGVNVVFTLRAVYLLIRELLREKGLMHTFEEALVRVRSMANNSQVRLDVGGLRQDAHGRQAARKTDKSKSKNKKEGEGEEEEVRGTKKKRRMMKKKKKQEKKKTTTTQSAMQSVELATTAPRGSAPISADEIFRDRLQAASEQLSNGAVNPLISVQKGVRANPVHRIVQRGERGDARAATAALSASSANKNDEEDEEDDEEAVRYCYTYDADGDIFFYREDGVGSSVWDLPEGAVCVEMDE
jgi:hypothetical protein